MLNFQRFWWEIASAGVECVEVRYPDFPSIRRRFVYTTYRVFKDGDDKKK